MFASALALARAFTRPAVVSVRSNSGKVDYRMTYPNTLPTGHYRTTVAYTISQQ